MNILRIVYDFADEFVAAEGLSTGPYELTLAQAKLVNKVYVLTGNLNGRNFKRMRFWYSLCNKNVIIFNLPRALKYIGVFLTASVCVLPYYFYLRFTKKIDVVHVHQQMGVWFWVYKFLFGRIDRIPVVYTNHGPIKARFEKLIKEGAPLSVWFKYFEYPLWSFNDWIAVKVADKIIAVSTSVKSELINLYNPTKQIFVLENGVNLDKFNISNKKINFDFADGSIVIGDVGRLSQRKNIHLLIESLVTLPAKYKLVLIGEWDDEYKQKMIDPILEKSDKEGNKIGNRVKYLGIKNYWEVDNYFRSFDIFALPSMHEGLPKVVLEAIASGNRVVTSGFTIAHQIPNLHFLDQITAEAIAAKIIMISNNPSDYENSIKILKEFYSWDTKAFELDKIYISK